MANWRDLLGTFQATFKIGGKNGPTLQQVLTDRLRLPDKLRFLDGGIAEIGELVSDSSGDLSVRRHNMTATVAPTADEDAGDGYEVGSVWIDVTNDKAYICVDSTVTAAVWRVAGESTQSLGNRSGVDITFSTASNPYKDANSTSLEKLASFIYPGSLSFLPTSYAIVLSRGNEGAGVSAGIGTVRLFDYTNSLEIATLTIAAGLVKTQVIATGTVTSANLPTGQALIEVQAKKELGGSDKVNLYFVQLR